jgi:excisionase family DNA binding protein
MTNRNNLEPLTLTINDACKVIGIGRTSLYELIRQGRLKTIKVAGRTLVPMAALRVLVEGAE